MEHFYVITNRLKDPELLVTSHIVSFLQEQNKTCVVHSTQTNETDAYTEASGIPGNTDCILVLGGDGTLLQAARDTVGEGIPLLGVNLGTLGYLAEVDASNLDDALLQLIRDEYEVETRMMLSGKIIRNGIVLEETYALNDIVIARGSSLCVLQFNIYVNGQFLNHYQADGIIAATPTGSTGYNMSAGGPIVEPKARLIVLTPICPHTLNTRSIVLAPEDEIEIEMVEGRDGRKQCVEANFDGSHRRTLEAGDRIQVRKFLKETEIIKLNRTSFLETLHKKMSGA